MAGRLKEDEKNERVIRGLLKLPENRRCINCNSLGPQYVCINFWTFVCTTCSGIHREFTHRVKSISMAKFTSQEVSALQGGGNASAKEIYLKEWDPQSNSFPDGSNVERLRNFIKHVYVDRRYSGERRFEKPPRGKSETEDLNENRRVDAYQGGSRSPPYEDRYNDKPVPGGRSPGHDYKRSPARAEVINDWRREDRFGNGRRSEEYQSSDGSSTFESKSPDRQRYLNTSSPPVVRPVRDILGENVGPLRVIEPPKENGGRSTDASIQTQRTASSSSLASSNGNPTEIKTEMSLIDFDADPEPVSTAAAPQTQQSTTATLSVPISSGADNWANFDSLQMRVSPSNTNPLDVLSDLVTPAPISSHMGGTPASAAPVGVLPGVTSSSPVAAGLGNSAGFSPDGIPTPASGPASHAGGQWSNMQPQHPSLFPPTGGQSIHHHSAPVVGGPSSNQPWNPLAASSTQGLQNAATTQVPQTVTTAFQATSGVAGLSSSVEVKSLERNALPEDLFTATYLPTHVPIPSWYAAPPQGIGLTMQYSMPVPTTYGPAPQIKSSNPFDTPDDPSPLQASMFPSMASAQDALPNIEVSTEQTFSLGTVTPHPFAMPQHAPSYALPSNSYMGQQVAGSMPQRPHGLAGFGLDGAAFGAINTNLQPGGLDSAPTAQNTFSYVG